MADTIYKDTRKKHNLTRDEVCDEASLLDNPIQPERLERIENGKFPITPDEIMLLAEIYGEPTPCVFFAVDKLSEVANNAIDKNCTLSCNFKDFNISINPSS